jgi:hypothetical protein
MSMNALFSRCRRWRKVIRIQVVEAGREEPVGLAAHLSGCVCCRRYAEDIRRATAAVGALSRHAVSSSPGLRSRWTRAVREEARPSTLSEFLTEPLRRVGCLVKRNRRPLFALAPVWLAILLLRLAAPVPAPSPLTAPAHSPGEILRTLKSEEALLTQRGLRPAVTVPSRPAHSRSPDESWLWRQPRSVCALQASKDWVAERSSRRSHLPCFVM